MYVIREVLHCKPGKVRQMLEKFKSISALMKEMGHEPLRLLTDVSAQPFWTIVAEATVDRIDDFFAMWSAGIAITRRRFNPSSTPCRLPPLFRSMIGYSVGSKMSPVAMTSARRNRTILSPSVVACWWKIWIPSPLNDRFFCEPE